MSQQKKPQADCRATALDLLSRREHSRFELSNKLSSRGFDQEQIHAVLASLTAQDLLSEDRFAEHYVHVRRRRGFGPLRIDLELRERRVPGEVIEQYLAAADDWLEVARREQQKKFGGRMPADFKEFSRQARFLQGRGFSAETIRQVLGDFG